MSSAYGGILCFELKILVAIGRGVVSGGVGPGDDREWSGCGISGFKLDALGATCGGAVSDGIGHGD